MKKWTRRLVLGVVLLLVGVVGGHWVYINLIKQDAPEALTLEPSTTTIAPESSTTIAVESTTTTAPASTIDGDWKIFAESIVGYRVKETIIGQKTEGVGRTSEITGSLTIADEQVTAAEFT
ncbi:MAG: YceI family protein, partial [Actinomycetota bacterium]